MELESLGPHETILMSGTHSPKIVISLVEVNPQHYYMPSDLLVTLVENQCSEHNLRCARTLGKQSGLALMHLTYFTTLATHRGGLTEGDFFLEVWSSWPGSGLPSQPADLEQTLTVTKGFYPWPWTYECHALTSWTQPQQVFSWLKIHWSTSAKVQPD